MVTLILQPARRGTKPRPCWRCGSCSRAALARSYVLRCDASAAASSSRSTPFPLPPQPPPTPPPPSAPPPPSLPPQPLPLLPPLLPPLPLPRGLLACLLPRAARCANRRPAFLQLVGPQRLPVLPACVQLACTPLVCPTLTPLLPQGLSCRRQLQLPLPHRRLGCLLYPPPLPRRSRREDAKARLVRDSGWSPCSGAATT
jgi:hypothetical protein